MIAARLHHSYDPLSCNHHHHHQRHHQQKHYENYQNHMQQSSFRASPSYSTIDINNNNNDAAMTSASSLKAVTLPRTDPTRQEADELLASAMNGLSGEERDQVVSDVSAASATMSGGVQGHEDKLEDKEYVAKKLSELDAALSGIRTKPAYLRAKVQSPEYVTNREFRLQFLLADSFQPRPAAERLVAYFESKLALFGTDKLTKDLTLSDLSPAEINCLELGVVQRLAGTDHAGRAVVSCWPTTTREPSITTENKLKSFWYLVNTIGNSGSSVGGSAGVDPDFDVQKKGVVTVVFGRGPSGQADRTTLWQILYLFRSMPTRVASIHYCYDDPEAAKSIVNLAIKALDPKSRARFRTHYGTHRDIVAELNTFGIGSNLLTGDPWSEEAAMVIREWFANQRLKESMQREAQSAARGADASSGAAAGGGSSSSSKLEPGSHASSSSAAAAPVAAVGGGARGRRLTKDDIGPYDILFGRGKGVQAHPGNKRLREHVETNLERYEKANRLEKTLIAEMIVRSIKDTSGRFLKLESASRGGGWTEVDFDTARDKIAHAFRTRRKAFLVERKQRGYKAASRAAAAAAISLPPVAVPSAAAPAGGGNSSGGGNRSDPPSSPPRPSSPSTNFGGGNDDWANYLPSP